MRNAMTFCAEFRWAIAQCDFEILLSDLEIAPRNFEIAQRRRNDRKRRRNDRKRRRFWSFRREARKPDLNYRFDRKGPDHSGSLDPMQARPRAKVHIGNNLAAQMQTNLNIWRSGCLLVKYLTVEFPYSAFKRSNCEILFCWERDGLLC